MTTRPEQVLLMSGGIGDYLHYLSRLPHYLLLNEIDTSNFIIYVESTVPEQVMSLFQLAFSNLNFAYVPARLHWTKTNPLLVPYRVIDRTNRPAYRYISSLGFSNITDWFLPFLCANYHTEQEPLLRIVNKSAPAAKQHVVISARDKGFLWWPAKEICDEIKAVIDSRYDILYLGTDVEKGLLRNKVEQVSDVAKALALSYHAQLFIGTDTGLATIRELTGKKNIYCINEYWLNELMYKYKYLSESLLEASGSVIAFNQDQLLTKLSEHLESN